MTRTLPILTMCTFTKFGTGGGKDVTNAMCVLPVNIVHQKFFLFVWFWLIFLTAITVVNIIMRIAVFAVPFLRSLITMKCWTGMSPLQSFSTIIVLLVAENGNQMDKRIKTFINGTSFPDWLVMSFIHTNLTSVDFQNFLEDLVYQFDCSKTH